MIRAWLTGIIGVAIISVLSGQVASANERNIVIEAVQADATTAASDEYVALKNTSESNVDLSGWRLTYTSASGATTTNLVTIPSSPITHVFMPAGARETMFSTSLATRLALPAGGVQTFTGGMNPVGGSITLMNGNGMVVDRVGWGSAVTATTETAPAPKMTEHQSLLRIAGDTDDNSIDFALSTDAQVGTLTYGALYDVDDLCSNLADIQPLVPTGLVRTTDGRCINPDICSNIDGVQLVVPDGYESNGNLCQPIDYCPNIAGIQATIDGYEVVDGRCVVPFIARDIRISELLPNPAGSDTGSEFVELYNADTQPVLLDDYSLYSGGKAYVFPAGKTIAPGEYVVFSDEDLGLTLVNITGKVIELRGRDASVIAEVPAYANAPNDQSWALIGGVWQFTNRPTPGASNLSSLVVTKPTTAVPTELAPCGEGKYRNPETNRCKSYEATAVASVTPCKEGQYRSEATNRCRSIAATVASTLTPCGEGKFRNPETNRCKAIASTDDTLVPCDEGYERNPETNRCRKIVSSTGDVPSAAFPVEPVIETGKAFTGWWVLGGASLLGLAYAGWEWRHEARRGMMRVIHMSTKS